MKAKFNNYWETHNISREVGRYAENLGLECLSTGGGFDYIYRRGPTMNVPRRQPRGRTNCGDEVEITLVSDNDGSPKTLDEACSVCIHMGNGGTQVPWLQFRFPNARDAMRWMKEMPLTSAGVPR